MGGFGEVLARYENAVELDPEVKDSGASRPCASTSSSATTRRRWPPTWRTPPRRCFEEAGIEVVDVSSDILTEGWSIHELGTARMGNDPKTSVLNQYQQSHDVKNLFVVDGSSHVSASCQNPTWTIMALCLAVVRAPGRRAPEGEPVSGISRRDLLRKSVGATIVAPLARLAPAAAAVSTASAGSALAASAVAAGLFFTASEMAQLDELTEAIIPADAQSGGARAAGVVPFLDRSLAERDAKIPDDAEERKRWKDGLARVDEVAREMHGRAFLEATPEQRLAVLSRMAQNEQDPQAPEERFFRQLKRATAQAYYSSKIGIHDDIQYKGNTLLTEFVGTDVS